MKDDYLQELIGTRGQEEYEKMERSDSQIRKVMHAVNNPIKSASWAIEPASDEEKDLKAAQLIEQILFKDMEDGFAANKISVRSVYKVYNNGYLCKFNLLNLGKICSEMKNHK